MIKKLVLAATLTALGLPALAGGSHYEQHHYGSYGHSGNVIVVSCFRGPWNEVIWDRPNAIFVDSLVNVGYDFPTASAIAERVCRDQNLVGNPGALKSNMERIWRDPASHRRHTN